MKKRISKRVREEAAMLCAIAASWPMAISIRDVTEHLHGVASNRAAWLAVRAWSEANRSFVRAGRNACDSASMRDDYAEAESLLRCGWSPP